MEKEMRIPPIKDLLNYTDQVVLVTGGGSGLGSGIVRRFAEAGAKVVVNFHSSEEKASALEREINSMGGEALGVQADVSKKTDVENLFKKVVDIFGQINVLVNNAGIYPLNKIIDMDEAEWDAVINANLRSAFLCTQAAAKIMIEQKTGGAIINISSIEGKNPAPMHSHYNAAKGGINMLTTSSANELGKYGIRVNAVSPGLIGREGLKNDWPDGVSRYLAAAPLGRLGEPADVADACLFLASPGARWITGANLKVDGGVMTNQIF
jgi:NAD(P)-dependent dehydrogenase (short-subunit alcohol dehydrogenase family)